MQRLLRGLRRPDTYVPMLVVAVVFAIAATFSDLRAVQLVTNGIYIAVWVTIMIVWAPAFMRVLRAESFQREQNLVAGILILWTSIALSRIWTIVYLLSNKPAWMEGTLIPTFFYFIAATSGYYFIKVAGVSPTGWRYTIAAGIAALVLSMLLLMFVN